MSKINTFLQKRKMHENRHGIYMVVVAYVLSFLMLFLGSDVFYNIKSTAAGIKNETDEATLELKMGGELGDTLAELRAQKLQAKYAYTQAQDSSDDTALLLESTNAQEYVAFLEPMDRIHQTGSKELNDIEEKQETEILLAKEVPTETTKKASENETKEASGSIKSLSVKAADTKEVSKEIKSDSKKTEESKEAIGNQYVYDVTAGEIEMLERIVQAEAGSEDAKGRILVANVVLNRVADEAFPDTIEDVIFQNADGEYQFSPVSDKRFWSVKVTKKTKEAVQKALQGEDISEGALYFMARKRARTSSAKWFDNNLEKLFKHGGHEFYK